VGNKLQQADGGVCNDLSGETEMMRRRLIIDSGVSWLALLLVFSSANVFAQNARNLPSEVIRYADTVYVNAHIVTLDNHEINPDPGSIVEAMAVRDEVIIGLGSDRDMLRMAGPDTEVVCATRRKDTF
jgi:hypothetical protein